MSILDNIRTAAVNWLFQGEELSDPALAARMKAYATQRAYQMGQQKRQIKVKPGQADDNIVINFCELVVERSVSLLLGKGITFDLPGDDESQEDVYLGDVWRLNKQNIFLHLLAQFGAVYGTCFVKIIPDGLDYGGQAYPRLVRLHPAWMTVDTDPEDQDRVLRYIMRYNTKRGGKEIARKEVTEAYFAKATDEQGQMWQTSEIAGWTISNYIASNDTRGQWQETGVIDWQYPFAPIHHWQNLPNAESCYGKSDIDGLFDVQDRFNFVSSNVSKIIRYHAHPKTWARGFNAPNNASWGADEMVIASGHDAMVANLEMGSDLSSSRAFANDLRQSLFDLARTVDLTSISDKIGGLTNFGLRVLFMDALNKNGTKRELYENGLTEINHRLLVLGGQTETDGGQVIWPDPLPVNETESAQAVTSDLAAGIVSKQTASTKRGYEWADEQERIEQDAASQSNIGAQLLGAFTNGG